MKQLIYNAVDLILNLTYQSMSEWNSTYFKCQFSHKIMKDHQKLSISDATGMRLALHRSGIRQQAAREVITTVGKKTPADKKKSDSMVKLPVTETIAEEIILKLIYV